LNSLMGFRSLFKGKERAHEPANDQPPEWQPAQETSHQFGLLNEASDEDYRTAEAFCEQYPETAPRLLPSMALDAIAQTGCRAWGLSPPQTNRFLGTINNPATRQEKSSIAPVVYVETQKECQDVCLLSDLPIIAGLYESKGKEGVYYEIIIRNMEGFIAIGTTCLPYPQWRLPGWNRSSAALHLDDFRKFYEDPDGGRDYETPLNLTHISPGDSVGCGYDFNAYSLFFTYNGVRLPSAFTGIYQPRHNHDVFAAIGVSGKCEFEVNFGAEDFRFKPGNEWSWKVDGQMRMTGSSGDIDDELPAYGA